jgi:hypothetical protein
MVLLLLLIGLIRAGAPPSVVYKKTGFYGLLSLDHQSIDWWNSYLKNLFYTTLLFQELDLF